MGIKIKEENIYDVVVIGAGHAGCEAALSSARNGSRTLLVSINMDSIAIMPYGSTVGGTGKSQLLREVDILGGEISKNIDKTSIHLKELKNTKSRASAAFQAIVDRREYSLSMKEVLEKQSNLDLRQGLAVNVKEDKSGYYLYTSDGIVYSCRSIIICTGTFLKARIFWGDYMIEAGRQGEICSKKLLDGLKNLGFRFGKLKNYAAPVVDKRSIDLDNLKKQQYSRKKWTFSYESNFKNREQIYFYITYINKDFSRFLQSQAANIKDNGISNYLDISEDALSVEDRVLKKEDIEGIEVSIKPLGRDTKEAYLNGLETAVSEELQVEMLRKIKNFESVEITRPGYGIEYYYLLPYQLKGNLGSKTLNRFFFAGQVNGTAGYEESAAQGLIAGINASREAKNLTSIVINREDGYIGKLINSLTEKESKRLPSVRLTINDKNFCSDDSRDVNKMVKILLNMGSDEKAEIIMRNIINK
ncbi:MAG: FAD-dependent oxidoreductase [Actinomycetota bacterium]